MSVAVSLRVMAEMMLGLHDHLEAVELTSTERAVQRFLNTVASGEHCSGDFGDSASVELPGHVIRAGSMRRRPRLSRQPSRRDRLTCRVGRFAVRQPADVQGGDTGVVLESILRYPIKSMLGELLEAVRIDECGLEGDRAWAVLEVSTGLVASAKHPAKWSGLLSISAHQWNPGSTVGVELPDGQRLDSGSVDFSAGLSEHLGRQVRLVAGHELVGEIERTDPTANTFDADDGELELAASARGRLGAASPAGTLFDHAPVHVIASETIRELGRREPDAGVDVTRFRPNLVVDVSGGPFIENELVGCEMSIGEQLVLEVIAATPRCVVPTLAHGELPWSPSVLRAVARHNQPEVDGLGRRPCIGAYAIVRRRGSVEVGDLVSCSTNLGSRNTTDSRDA